MSKQTQIKYMKQLGELLGQDLTYIHGPRESGPKGTKKEFLNIGKAFLRAMGKDLQLALCKVQDNPAGIGSTGDITLMGMWSEANGIYINLHEDVCTGCILYRSSLHMKDYTGGNNNFLPRSILKSGDYDYLLRTVFMLRQEDSAYGRAS